MRLWQKRKKPQTPQPGIEPGTPANAADALPLSHRDKRHHQPVCLKFYPLCLHFTIISSFICLFCLFLSQPQAYLFLDLNATVFVARTSSKHVFFSPSFLVQATVDANSRCQPNEGAVPKCSRRTNSKLHCKTHDYVTYHAFMLCLLAKCRLPSSFPLPFNLCFLLHLASFLRSWPDLSNISLIPPTIFSGSV